MKRQWTRGEKLLWATPLLVGVFGAAIAWGPQLARRALDGPNVWRASDITSIRSMALSSNGEILAAGGGSFEEKTGDWLPSSGTVALWDARTGAQLPPIAPIHTRDKTGFLSGFDVYALAISPDASVIGLARVGEHWTLYNVATRKLLWRFSRSASGATFSPDGRAIALSIDAGVFIVDAHNGRIKTQWKSTGSPYSADISWSPDGKLVANIGDHKAKERLELHRASDGKLVRRFPVAQGFKSDSVNSVKFSPDGKHLIVASSVSNSFGESDFSTYAPLRCFDVQTGKRLWQVKAPTLGGSDSFNASVCDAVFSPDGRTIAAHQFWKGTILLLDSATGSIKSTRQLGKAGQSNFHVPPGLLFAPDGKRLFVRGSSAVVVMDLD